MTLKVLRMEDEGCEVTMLNQLRNKRLEVLKLLKQQVSKLLAGGLNLKEGGDTVHVESESMTSVGTLVVAAMLAGERYGRGMEEEEEGCEVTMLNELGLKTLLNEVRNSRLVLIKLLELESKLLAGGLNSKKAVTLFILKNEVGSITELVEAPGIKESSVGDLNLKEGGDTVHVESEPVTSGGIAMVAAMPFSLTETLSVLFRFYQSISISLQQFPCCSIECSPESDSENAGIIP
ncbi:hypothetical protein L1987_11104 [Smallanthus sonchifolius]|uniref:Uncharacterized protein n=1 Tax=Smallanthus sonchifolius TaxID=185202 RepID=A0ACB9JC35_9ASTR|nr:hypothetical protein L1987_11104 [Smallanthus sonchifolius]